MPLRGNAIGDICGDRVCVYECAAESGDGFSWQRTAGFQLWKGDSKTDTGAGPVLNTIDAWALDAQAQGKYGEIWQLQQKDAKDEEVS